MEDGSRNFRSTLEEGKEGEELIKSYLESNGYIVTDVSDDLVYRKQDVDFVCRKGDKTFTLEVKTDNRMCETGNFPVEIAMYRRTEKRPGWFHYCKADVICFFDNVLGHVYFIDWVGLKERVIMERVTYEEIITGTCEPSRLFEPFWNKKMFSNYIDGCAGELCLAPIKEAIEYTYVELSQLSGSKLR